MHCLHVVHVGLMGNLHYLEILDFPLGWFGWDICGDDYATRLAQREAAAPEGAEQAEDPSKQPRRKPRRADVGPLDAQP